MLRTSTFLAMVLSATAIASATTPAAALSSQFMGGASNHLVSQFHPAPAPTSVQPSREAQHVLTPVSPPPKIVTPGRSSVGSSMYPIPKYPGAGTVMKNAELPASELPAPPSQLGKGIDDICLLNKYKCPPSKPQPPKPQPQPGPVVIVTPPVEIPVQVPVAVPYNVPAHVASAASYAAATPARPAASQPVASQCGAAGGIPALAAGIDQLLPTAQLSEPDMSKVTELRQMIQVLSMDGKASAARDVEEIAMNILGYQKVWLRCGLGTFDWEKQVASADSVQQK